MLRLEHNLFTLNVHLLPPYPRLDFKCGSDAWISSRLSFPRLQRHKSFFFFSVRVDVQVFSWVKMMVKELGRELGSAGLSWRNYAPEHQSEQHQSTAKSHIPRVCHRISASLVKTHSETVEPPWKHGARG